MNRILFVVLGFMLAGALSFAAGEGILPKDKSNTIVQAFAPVGQQVKVVGTKGFVNFTTGSIATGRILVGYDYRVLDADRNDADADMRVGGFATGAETDAFPLSGGSYGVGTGVNKVGFRVMSSASVKTVYWLKH